MTIWRRMPSPKKVSQGIWSIVSSTCFLQLNFRSVLLYHQPLNLDLPSSLLGKNIMFNNSLSKGKINNHLENKPKFNLFRKAANTQLRNSVSCTPPARLRWLRWLRCSMVERWGRACLHPLLGPRSKLRFYQGVEVKIMTEPVFCSRLYFIMLNYNQEYVQYIYIWVYWQWT